MDVYLSVVGRLEPRKILPEENAANNENYERGKKNQTLARAPPGIGRNWRSGRAGLGHWRALYRRRSLRRIRCLILFSHTHSPFRYSAKLDSATPIALARDIFARL